MEPVELFSSSDRLRQTTFVPRDWRSIASSSLAAAASLSSDSFLNWTLWLDHASQQLAINVQKAVLEQALDDPTESAPRLLGSVADRLVQLLIASADHDQSLSSIQYFLEDSIDSTVMEKMLLYACSLYLSLEDFQAANLMLMYVVQTTHCRLLKYFTRHAAKLTPQPSPQAA